MARSNLDATLRARVTPETSEAFSKLCNIERTTTSDKLRALVEAYVASARLATTVELDVEIEITKAPRNDRFLDSAYYITARLVGDLEAGDFSRLTFYLPEFFLSNGIEQCRIDSAYTHRVDGPEAVTRRNSQRQLLSAALVDHCWKGGIYIYHLPNGESEDACVDRVSVGLKANILEAAARRVESSLVPDTGAG